MAVIVPVSDPEDERLSDYVALSDRDLRRSAARTGGRADFLIAEGHLVIRQLLVSDYRLRSLLVTARGLKALGAQLPSDPPFPVFLAPEGVVRAVCGFPFHRGALASADRGDPLDPAVLAAGSALVVVAEGMNDHENLGALFRNAAAFGAGAVILDPTCADPLYRRSIRVSMGQVLRLPFGRAGEWPGFLGTLRELGFQVLALTPSPEATEIRQLRPGRRPALLVGAEGRGLSEAALRACDQRVRIPLASGVDSLNVATSAAVALYQLGRGWS